MSRDPDAPPVPSSSSPPADGRSSSPQPVPPPALPAHLFEMIAPLSTLLERILTPQPTAETAADGLGGSIGGVGVAGAGAPTPLAIKDFQGEVLRLKHSLAAARTQLRGLPDLERGVDGQQAEFALLRKKLDRAEHVRREVRDTARAVAERRREERQEDDKVKGEKTDEDKDESMATD